MHLGDKVFPPKNDLVGHAYSPQTLRRGGLTLHCLCSFLSAECLPLAGEPVTCIRGQPERVFQNPGKGMGQGKPGEAERTISEGKG
jgi:hypothetical protein